MRKEIHVVHGTKMDYMQHFSLKCKTLREFPFQDIRLSTVLWNGMGVLHTELPKHPAGQKKDSKTASTSGSSIVSGDCKPVFVQQSNNIPGTECDLTPCYDSLEAFGCGQLKTSWRSPPWLEIKVAELAWRIRQLAGMAIRICKCLLFTTEVGTTNLRR